MVKGPGAKDLYGYEVCSRWKYNALLSGLLQVFEGKLAGEIEAFVSCGMQGSDWVFFEAAEVYRKKHPEVRNFLYEPFNGIHERWKDYGMFPRWEYEKMRYLAAKEGALICCGSVPGSPREYGLAVRNATALGAREADAFVCIVRWCMQGEALEIEPGEVRRFALEQSKLGKQVVLLHPETLYVVRMGQERVAV